jgi:hypothetical protein
MLVALAETLKIVDDYKCLLKLDEIEKIFDLILQKAGLKR